eukprot:GHRR01014867.1.p1 GENE.GHRR01014867.1~~GHRR01014867.1.p1  ORF type:complete len:210 (+),score=52.45 GHRR01014867.1:181-810(+)
MHATRLLQLLGIHTVVCMAVISNALQSEPTDLSAADRGLTDRRVKARLLAEEGFKYYNNVTDKRFGGNVLGYVTPWNSHGYEVAVRWRAKFSHISPVWYQLRPGDKEGSFQLSGGHDVDQKWISRLRQPAEKEADADSQICVNNKSGAQTCGADASAPYKATTLPLIVPRVVVELTPKQTVQLLQKPGQAIDLLVSEMEQQGFDGLVSL